LVKQKGGKGGYGGATTLVEILGEPKAIRGGLNLKGAKQKKVGR